MIKIKYKKSFPPRFIALTNGSLAPPRKRKPQLSNHLAMRGAAGGKARPGWRWRPPPRDQGGPALIPHSTDLLCTCLTGALKTATKVDGPLRSLPGGVCAVKAATIPPNCTLKVSRAGGGGSRLKAANKTMPRSHLLCMQRMSCCCMSQKKGPPYRMHVSFFHKLAASLNDRDSSKSWGCGRTVCGTPCSRPCTLCTRCVLR